MSKFRRIVILTGAGISAESGVDTFRDKDGIWSKVDYRDVATPQGFHRNPALVHEFYNERRRRMADVQPNAAHIALARLEREFAGDFLLVTQNIDDLHERAGSRKLVHMHGELAGAWCTNCGTRCEWHDDLSTRVPCLACHVAGFMRPDVVWFGEFPSRMDEIETSIGACDLFVSIGTSGNVYPAAGFVEEARNAGAHTVELNLEPSEGHNLFAEAEHGRATEIVPAFVERLLGKG
ncbi:NAD-dependent deacetylase [Mesorhizobium albiziae]|uniref:NAD-dependent protein deacylase n=1 Tax=Neomesorhizobium albiziae TaxID=335020 RepID=A0A1I4DXJ6_9HYPH|nr:NAD-dependent deacylase [Mesorhizobium albiziae]GLS32735.1 NAD-dependent protein deacylase [Mesorhizobium albiziae]SFK97679.1 NAD-dependent deacetylase [Mesorhizobium albiziae]